MPSEETGSIRDALQESLSEMKGEEAPSGNSNSQIELIPKGTVGEHNTSDSEPYNGEKVAPKGTEPYEKPREAKTDEPKEEKAEDVKAATIDAPTAWNLEDQERSSLHS